MCVHTVYVTLCNHDPGAQGKSSMAVQGWRTRVYVEDFPWLSCFSRTLDGQSTRIWHVQIPVMAKFSQILQKRSTKDNVSNHPTPRFPGQTNHCLLLIASLSTLGRSFKGAQPVHSVPEDCDGKKHFGTNVSSMTKGYKRLSWMCTPVSIW